MGRLRDRINKRRGDTRFKKFIGWIGVTSASLLLVTIAVSLLIAIPWFSWAIHPLSQLGYCVGDLAPSSRFVFNPGLIITGALAVIFGIGLLFGPNKVVWIIGAIIFILAALLIVLTGVFCLPNMLHNIVAPTAFAILPVAFGFFTFGFFFAPANGLFSKVYKIIMGIFSAIVTAICAAAVIYALYQLANGIMAIAVPESILISASALWMIVVGTGYIKGRL